MAAGRKLARAVYVKDEKDNVVWFHPGDVVPAWAAKQITNPSAWGEDAADEVEDEPAPEKPKPARRGKAPE